VIRRACSVTVQGDRVVLHDDCVFLHDDRAIRPPRSVTMLDGSDTLRACRVTMHDGRRSRMRAA